MTVENLPRGVNAFRGYLAYGYQGNAQDDTRDCWRYAYVGCLAEPARRFILAIGMSVRRYLKKKNERQECKRKRQRPRNSPPGFMRKPLHCYAPLRHQNSPMRSRNGTENIPIIVSLRCEPLQEGFASRYRLVHRFPAISGTLPCSKRIRTKAQLPSGVHATLRQNFLPVILVRGLRGNLQFLVDLLQ